MRKTCAIAAFALLLAFLPFEAGALEPPDYIRANFGVLIESQLNPNFDGNVSSPSINFDFGLGLNYPFAPESRLSFAPSGHFYSYYGEYNSGQPVSADQAFSSTYIIGIMLDAPVMYTLPLGNSGDFTLSAGAGLCLDLRLALQSGDIEATSSSASADDAASLSNTYFWSEGRFIDPSTTINLDYRLNDRMGVGFMGRVLWPIYNLWTGEGYGFLDQTKYILNITIRYKLKPKGGSAADATPTVSPAPPQPGADSSSAKEPPASPPTADASQAPAK
jgi:hypothetical protein